MDITGTKLIIDIFPQFISQLSNNHILFFKITLENSSFFIINWNSMTRKISNEYSILIFKMITSWNLMKKNTRLNVTYFKNIWANSINEWLNMDVFDTKQIYQIQSIANNSFNLNISFDLHVSKEHLYILTNLCLCFDWMWKDKSLYRTKNDHYCIHYHHHSL